MVRYTLEAQILLRKGASTSRQEYLGHGKFVRIAKHHIW
jgi:hypothetical protein